MNSMHSSNDENIVPVVKPVTIPTTLKNAKVQSKSTQLKNISNHLLLNWQESCNDIPIAPIRLECSITGTVNKRKADDNKQSFDNFSKALTSNFSDKEELNIAPISLPTNVKVLKQPTDEEKAQTFCNLLTALATHTTKPELPIFPQLKIDTVVSTKKKAVVIDEKDTLKNLCDLLSEHEKMQNCELPITATKRGNSVVPNMQSHVEAKKSTNKFIHALMKATYQAEILSDNRPQTVCTKTDTNIHIDSGDVIVPKLKVDKSKIEETKEETAIVQVIKPSSFPSCNNVDIATKQDKETMLQNLANSLETHYATNTVSNDLPIACIKIPQNVIKPVIVDQEKCKKNLIEHLSQHDTNLESLIAKVELPGPKVKPVVSNEQSEAYQNLVRMLDYHAATDSKENECLIHAIDTGRKPAVEKPSTDDSFKNLIRSLHKIAKQEKVEPPRQRKQTVAQAIKQAVDTMCEEEAIKPIDNVTGSINALKARKLIDMLSHMSKNEAVEKERNTFQIKDKRKRFRDKTPNSAKYIITSGVIIPPSNTINDEQESMKDKRMMNLANSLMLSAGIAAAKIKIESDISQEKEIDVSARLAEIAKLHHQDSSATYHPVLSSTHVTAYPNNSSRIVEHHETIQGCKQIEIRCQVSNESINTAVDAPMRNKKTEECVITPVSSSTQRSTAPQPQVSVVDIEQLKRMFLNQYENNHKY